MSIQILLFFCLISIIYGDIDCRTTSWWVLQSFPKSILQEFLSQCEEKLQFNSSNPLAKYMKEDEHPVYFEFNQQNQCEESALPPYLANLTEQTFAEFKLEIPYVISKNITVMFKPLIYQNSSLNVAATKLVYGLPTYFATMHVDFENNTYSILYKDGSVQASFEPLKSNFFPFSSPEAVNFSSFVDANISPWLAFPPLSLFKTECAYNLYSFTTAYVRPVTMTLKVIGNIFEAIPNGTYTNAGDQPLGAWQIDVHTRITSPNDCPK